MRRYDLSVCDRVTLLLLPCRVSVSHIKQNGLYQGSHSLAYRKFQDFSTTYQDPQNVFPGLCRSPAMLNYRKTTVTYSVYAVWQYNPSQNVHHKLQRNCSLST